MALLFSFENSRPSFLKLLPQKIEDVRIPRARSKAKWGFAQHGVVPARQFRLLEELSFSTVLKQLARAFLLQKLSNKIHPISSGYRYVQHVLPSVRLLGISFRSDLRTA